MNEETKIEETKVEEVSDIEEQAAPVEVTEETASVEKAEVAE